MLSIFSRGKSRQQESHIRNLLLMANSDNNISKSEIQVIYDIGIEKGLNTEEIKDIIRDDSEKKLITPENVEDKFEQLYDLVLVMLADGIIEEDEIEFCTNVAEKFGFRKTIAALLIIYITEYRQKGLEKYAIYTLCRDLLE
jgi:uncharacterized tellurite resistance protein B-like protein